MTSRSDLFGRNRAAGCLAEGSEFFQPVWADEPADELLGQLLALIPSTWHTAQQSEWIHFRPPEVVLPPQGWKLHLSCAERAATECLRRAAPILVAYDVPFKMLGSLRLLNLSNGKGMSRGASGKFFTAYPQPGQFVAVADDLAQAVGELGGPYILSDRRHPMSSSVYYRYGQIALDAGIRSDGTQAMAVRDPEGRDEVDRRDPFFNPPAWVEDPYGARAPVEDSTTTEFLAHYKIERVLSFSNSGGVYVATDAQGRRVVLKEARANVTFPRGGDSRTALRKEFEIGRVLRLAGAAVPEMHAVHDVWENSFLVQSFVRGIPLGHWVISRSPAISAVSSAWKTYLDSLTKIWTDICVFVDTVHASGVVLGDFSVNNILITDDSDQPCLIFIDFEAAVRTGLDPDLGIYTLPFTSPERRTGSELSPADDLFSLGLILLGTLAFGPVHGPFAEQTLDGVLDLLRTRTPVPTQALNAIRSLLDQDTDARPPAGVARTIAGDLSCPVSKRKAVGERSRPSELAEQLAVAIIADAHAERFHSGPLYPCDPSGFRCGNFVSAAFGAAGVLHTLQYASVATPSSHWNWLLLRPLVGRRMAPGLYTGTAGVAWVLAGRGFEARARSLLVEASARMRTYSDPSIFSGSAGLALSWLNLHDRTASPGDLAAARDWADRTHELRLDNEEADPCYAFGSAGDLVLYSEMDRRDPAGPWIDHAAEAWLQARERLHVEGDRVVGLSGLGNSKRVSQYWLDGSAGLLTALSRFYSVAPSRDLRHEIDKIAESVCHDFVVMGGFFSGACGLGNALLDAAEATSDPRFEQLAAGFTDVIATYLVRRGHGLAMLGDQNARLSHDLGTGSAGALAFLTRLSSDGKLSTFDFVPAIDPHRPLMP